MIKGPSAWDILVEVTPGFLEQRVAGCALQYLSCTLLLSASRGAQDNFVSL